VGGCESRDKGREGMTFRRMIVLGQGHGECHAPAKSEVNSIWKEIAEFIKKILWNITQ